MLEQIGNVATTLPLLRLQITTCRFGERTSLYRRAGEGWDGRILRISRVDGHCLETVAMPKGAHLFLGTHHALICHYMTGTHRLRVRGDPDN